jgi:adenosylcobinamide-phosphate synthase
MPRRRDGLRAALVIGLLADRLLGDPARLHPVAGFGRAASMVERLLWRPSRAAGTLYAASLVGAAGTTAAVIDVALTRHRHSRLTYRALVVWAVLGGRSLERAAQALATAVEDGELERARLLAPTLVGRDPSDLDGGELCRAAVESVAENTSDAVVAPLLWCALLGVPGAAAFRAVNTLDAMVGHRSDRYLRFGWAAARLDDLACWPAARLSALLAIAWSPCFGGRRSVAWRAAWQDGAAHPSPNAGRVEGAFAGALSLRLGGLNRYPHGLEKRPSLGSGTPPTTEDVARAITLARLVGASALVLSMSLAWAAGG